MLSIAGEAILDDEKFTCVEEPLFSTISSVTLFIGGRPVFTQDSFNYVNYIRKLSVDKASYEETQFGLSGICMIK